MSHYLRPAYDMPRIYLYRNPVDFRKGFSDRLPRVRVDLVLTDEEKAGAAKTFFTKVKEELERKRSILHILSFRWPINVSQEGP
jgi:hypothetical protein